MAWTAGAFRLAKAKVQEEALGLLHPHAHPDLHILRMEPGAGICKETALRAPRGAREQHPCLRPLHLHSHYNSCVHRRVPAGDCACGPSWERHAALVQCRNMVHCCIHPGVRLAPVCVRRRRHVTDTFPGDAHERVRPLRCASLLFRLHNEGRWYRQHCNPSDVTNGATDAVDENIQAGSVRLRHSAHGRGPQELVAGHLCPRIPALHGRGALLERALPHGETKLSYTRDERCAARGVRRGVRRPVQSRLFAQVRPLLHAGRRAAGLPQHRRSVLVVDGHHDICRVRRHIPAHSAREVCRFCCNARRHGAHCLAGGHCRPEVPGRLRQTRPGRGQVARSQQDEGRGKDLGTRTRQRRRPEAKTAQHQGPCACGLHCWPGVRPGGRVGAARAAWEAAQDRVRSSGCVFQKGGEHA
mmetsp:Transcript_72959/g.165461  ORF Transcript_72959/g.165461 Transcript_72959/m.165461 type:complete len:414 (-) Transcript_72959:143-1384(-)